MEAIEPGDKTEGSRRRVDLKFRVFRTESVHPFVELRNVQELKLFRLQIPLKGKEIGHGIRQRCTCRKHELPAARTHEITLLQHQICLFAAF